MFFKRYNCSLSILKQTFAAFVDVYHTSTVGVFDRQLGNADIWINGGQTQPNGIKPGAHQAAPTFYVKSIATPSGSCQFKAWHCEDSDWQPFHNDKRDKEDTCQYGKSEIKVNYILCLNSICSSFYIIFIFAGANCCGWIPQNGRD